MISHKRILSTFERLHSVNPLFISTALTYLFKMALFDHQVCCREYMTMLHGTAI